MPDLTLYSMPSSGNSYKVRLLLALLGRDYTHVPCEAESEALKVANSDGALPMGKMPTLHLPDGRILTESNAILVYIAQGTAWMPEDSFDHARMLAWMFFEQNSHEPVIAVRAALRSYPHRANAATPERMADLLTQGTAILARMDDALAGRNWLVTDSPSLADIALFGYTSTAESRGGFDLAPFANVRAWIARMDALPGAVSLDGTQL
jgi:glutathione S-transferase